MIRRLVALFVVIGLWLLVTALVFAMYAHSQLALLVDLVSTAQAISRICEECFFPHLSGIQ